MVKISLNVDEFKKSLEAYKAKLTEAFTEMPLRVTRQLLKIVLAANPVGSLNNIKEYERRFKFSGYAAKPGLSSGSWVTEFDSITADREVSYGGASASMQAFDNIAKRFRIGETINVHNSVDYMIGNGYNWKGKGNNIYDTLFVVDLYANMIPISNAEKVKYGF